MQKTESTETSESDVIDDGLYNRQRYALGDGATVRLQRARVFVGACDGLAAEVAKNLALLGVARITLHSEPDERTAPFRPSIDGGVHIAYERTNDSATAATTSTRLDATVAYVARLNPHVSVRASPAGLSLATADEAALAKALADETCVVLVNALWDVAARVDAFCRARGIAFVWTALYGVCGSVFVDGGDRFVTRDADGEPCREVQLQERRGTRPVVCRCFPDERHGLETGDFVVFEDFEQRRTASASAASTTESATTASSSSPKEQVPGRVTVIDPFTFEVDTDGPAEPVVPGGTARQVKEPVELHFAPFAASAEAPVFAEADCAPGHDPALVHDALGALQRFAAAHGGALPRPWHAGDAAAVAALAHSADKSLARLLAATCACGRFQPLGAFLGGVVAHEVLKAAAAHGTPLHQWLHVTIPEVCSGDPDDPDAVKDHLPRGCGGCGCGDSGDSSKMEDDSSNSTNDLSYLDTQAVCIGWSTLSRLSELRAFVVGAGAIGCELLKNFALLGVATGAHGVLTVTDPDLIERSNLSRQFLFREADVRQPKAATAARAVARLAPRLHIRAATDKVCAETEGAYGPAFFGALDVVATALDNVPARRYVDACCVRAARPMLDSGTLGAKGHVQVVLPHRTEHYGAARDPAARDVPLCTIHAFPSHVDHCIQWARDVFARVFADRPAELAAALADPAWVDALARTGAPQGLAPARRVLRRLRARPRTPAACAAKARRLYARLFDARVRALLAQYPPDATNDDGSPVWAPPKRVPVPLPPAPGADPTAARFVRSAALIFADVYGVSMPPSLPLDFFLSNGADVEDHGLDNNTSEKGKKGDATSGETTTEGTAAKITKGTKPTEGATPMEQEQDPETLFQETIAALREELPKARAEGCCVRPAVFEKDCDANHHVDFVWAATNCRAANYGLGAAERLAVKRVAGHIVPALATTTAAVSGLVAGELVKLVARAPVAAHRNAFLNLALPLLCFSEPLPPARERVADGVYFTVWDNWDVHRPPRPQPFALQDFVAALERKVGPGLSVATVAQDGRALFLAFNPAHSRRLPLPFDDLLRLPQDGSTSVDLVVTFTKDDDDSDVEVPTIRYFF